MKYELKRGIETKGLSERTLESLGERQTENVCELLNSFATAETGDDANRYLPDAPYAMIYLETNDTLKFAETGDKLRYVEAFRIS